MNPAVMEPSHMPKKMRTTKRPAKLWQAAWAHRATAQIDIFKLPKSSFPAEDEGSDKLTSSIFRRGSAGEQGFEGTRKVDN